MESCSTDQKKAFTICSKLFGRNKKKTLPDFPPDTLSSTFDDYFHHKLTITLSNLPLYTSLMTPTMPTHSLNVFTVPSMSDIGILLKATKSSSPLDLIPLSLLHEITESLTIPLNNIFCESLKSVLFQHPINMHSLHPSLRYQTLTLRASTIIVQSQTYRYFPKLLFNITQNPSHLPKCISSFQININRTSEDIQRYYH